MAIVCLFGCTFLSLFFSFPFSVFSFQFYLFIFCEKERNFDPLRRSGVRSIMAEKRALPPLHFFIFFCLFFTPTNNEMTCVTGDPF
jgi:hypothetical protein